MKEYTLRELINGLENNQFSSLDLVKMYLNQIAKFDQEEPKLNSVAEINPDVFQIAKILDEERKIKGPRSKIHGLPILIKDNILTKDKMHTSASSYVLKDYYGTDDAFIVKKLREAGAIILGKANLSEFAYFMSFDDMPSGYGGRFGQVKSPYSSKIDPLGSSTGSAVSVAANLIPVSIGTETNGSLTAPALMNSIQTLKPSMGLVSRTGIIPISHHQDIAGPMARTIDDLAYIMDVIQGYDSDDLSTHVFSDNSIDFSKYDQIDVKNKRMGLIKFSNIDYSDEEKDIEKQAKEIFESFGVEVIDVEIKAEQIKNFDTLIYDFKVDLDAFMARYMKDYHVHSLEDIIKYNRMDPHVRMKYGQSIFEAAWKTEGNLKDKKYIDAFIDNLDKANIINRIMEEKKLDALLSVKRTQYAPIAGNPVSAVVAKELRDDSPRSIYITGRHFEDDLVLKLSSIYEEKANKRIAPDLNNIR